MSAGLFREWRADYAAPVELIGEQLGGGTAAPDGGVGPVARCGGVGPGRSLPPGRACRRPPPHAGDRTPRPVGAPLGAPGADPGRSAQVPCPQRRSTGDTGAGPGARAAGRTRRSGARDRPPGPVRRTARPGATTPARPGAPRLPRDVRPCRTAAVGADRARRSGGGAGGVAAVARDGGRGAVEAPGRGVGGAGARCVRGWCGGGRTGAAGAVGVRVRGCRRGCVVVGGGGCVGRTAGVDTGVGGAGRGRRRAAAEVLGRLGSSARVAVPGLSRLVEAECAWERTVGACALWRVTGEVERVLPVLRSAWVEHPGVRGVIAACLVDMGRPGRLCMTWWRLNSPRHDGIWCGRAGTGARTFLEDERLLAVCREVSGWGESGRVCGYDRHDESPCVRMRSAYQGRSGVTPCRALSPSCGPTAGRSVPTPRPTGPCVGVPAGCAGLGR
jgi:hypothetical protein